MVEIRQVLKESFPRVKFIGTKYTNADRDQFGSFSTKWGEWFQGGYFDRLNVCDGIEKVSDDYIGLMRMNDEAGENFEYWIGMFMAPNDPVPDGFDSALIEAGDVGVCYVCGNEKNGELYGPEASDMCMAEFSKMGLEYKPSTYCFERYNCPRFTDPDENGNVILDICAYF